MQQHLLIASIFVIPEAFLWFANSTIRIPFFGYQTNKHNDPNLTEDIHCYYLKYHIKKECSVNANGTVIITMKGSLKTLKLGSQNQEDQNQSQHKGKHKT